MILVDFPKGENSMVVSRSLRESIILMDLLKNIRQDY